MILIFIAFIKLYGGKMKNIAVILPGVWGQDLAVHFRNNLQN